MRPHPFEFCSTCRFKDSGTLRNEGSTLDNSYAQDFRFYGYFDMCA
jgi:hypothetical protein